MKQGNWRLFSTILVCMLFLGTGVFAHAKTMKIHIASWNVPKDPNTKVLGAIKADLEKASGGEVVGEISFKAIGKPSDYYDAVANGICDIAYVGLPYTPGQFPFSEMLGLPINFPDNTITTKAHYELLKRGYLDKQFQDVKVLAVGSTSPYNFLWGKEPVTTLAGFKGKKIRCPGGPWTKLTEALGGVPVSVSAAESYMALERGIIHGILQSWPAVPVFKLSEVCGHVTQLNLCGFSFAIVMNEYSYNKLPRAAKDVLEKNVEKYSLMMGAAHHGFNQIGMKMMAKAGGKVHSLSAEETKALQRLTRPILDEWVEGVEAKGLPGKKALDELYTILQELGVKEPFAK